MGLIHDHGTQFRKYPFCAGIGEQKDKALWRGQQNVGRIAPLVRALRLFGIARAIFYPDGQIHLSDGGFKIAPNVCRQSFEGRDVERVQSLRGGVGQINQGWQKPRQGLAAPRRRDQ